MVEVGRVKVTNGNVNAKEINTLIIYIISGYTVQFAKIIQMANW